MHRDVCNFMSITHSQFEMFINAREVNKIFHSIKFSGTTHMLMRVAHVYLYLYCLSSYLSSLVQACKSFPFLWTFFTNASCCRIYVVRSSSLWLMSDGTHLIFEFRITISMFTVAKCSYRNFISNIKFWGGNFFNLFILLVVALSDDATTV
jgi:hypothetical protein